MKSGEFAKLCGTTKNTLIHYDAMGLLPPSHVGDNGYRYYWRFLAIRIFVDAGFSLEEIRTALKENHDVELLTEIDDLRSRLMERLAGMQNSLAQLDEMKSLLTRSSIEAGDAPHVESRPARWLLACGSVAGMHPSPEFDYALVTDLSADALRTLETLGGRARISPYGMTATFEAGVVSYHELFFLLPEGVGQKEAKAEKSTEPVGSAWPSGSTRSAGSAKPVGPAEPALPSNLLKIDAGEYASIEYDEPWENIESAYEKLDQFIAAKGLTQESPYYEVARFWLADDQDSDYRCEIFARVE